MAGSTPLLLPLLPLLLLAVGTAGQKLAFGPCPDIPPVKNFNATAYSGLWYENRKFQNLFELAQKCITARYSVDLGGFISVENSGYLAPFYKPVRVYGYAYATQGAGVAALAVGFPAPEDGAEPNYNVIEVDYDKYAVVYSCQNVAGRAARKELLWLLTRKAQFPRRYANEIVVGLMRRGIKKAYQMTVTEQNFCPRENSYSKE